MSALRLQWKKQRVPYDVFYELTPRCTFDCKMCYVHLTREQMGDRRELSTEEWLRIGDDYYYAATGGKLAVNTTRYINKDWANGLLPVGTYSFGADGKMILN